MARYLKTVVGNIPGVQNRLITVQQNGDQYVVIVGGGDSYQIAYAIWQADFYTPGLAGATIEISGIDNTNPAIVHTADNHNLETGDVEFITGIVGMDHINNQTYSITVIDSQSFSIPVDATIMGVWATGGVVTPNPINMYVSINDYPDTFIIPYVNPPQELVEVIVTWITNSPNFVSPTAIAQAVVPVIVDYINSLPAGTTPINLNVMTQLFLEATSTILPGEYIIDIQWQLSIGGVGVFPAGGTQVIFGDRYSYFYTENGMITVGEG
jgi:hypothetical protein